MEGCRLPALFEWEIASDQLQWGQLWEWTNSHYAYPGFYKSSGALGDTMVNFMINQMILRGSAALLKDTAEKYRNFFHRLRWQFNGIRLAK
jgi:formylglycine-generating enzyme required for sulfatase activity